MSANSSECDSCGKPITGKPNISSEVERNHVHEETSQGRDNTNSSKAGKAPKEMYSMGGSEPLIEAKVVVLGDTGVGKTSILLQYVENKFKPTTQPTIGASFLSKTLWVNGIRVRLQLWDTAGQERFRSLAPMYYRGAAVALLVYDVESPESLKKVKGWVKELRTNIFEDIMLVGNQIDKPMRKVTNSEAAEYAASIGAICFETSAKKNIGIEEMFLEISKQLTEHVAPSLRPLASDSVNPYKEKQSSDSCCS